MVVIAIDGPSGAGKSTVARTVATRLECDYLDTGAMYRSVTWAVLDRGLDPSDGDSVAAVAKALAIDMDANPSGVRVCVDGHDVTDAIRGRGVSGAVSVVSAHPGVRGELVRRQREWAAGRERCVVEGRDIGTVVFPDAELKVFLTASEQERVRRRAAEAGGAIAAGSVERDRIDSTRAVSPLVAAPDAIIVDTTGRSVDDVVSEVLGHL